MTKVIALTNEEIVENFMDDFEVQEAVKNFGTQLISGGNYVESATALVERLRYLLSHQHRSKEVESDEDDHASEAS